MAEPKQLALWIAETAAGDQLAFQRLYKATSPHLYAHLLRILKTEDMAADALQDAFVKIWQKAETYVPERGAPITWLLSIARCRRRPEVALPEDPDMEAMVLSDDDANGPALDNETMQSLNAIQNCMKTLQIEQRKSLLYAYYDGMTHTEISQKMDAPLGTVKSWVRRGLLRLRECLAERPR